MIEKDISKEMKRDATLHDTYMMDELKVAPDRSRRYFPRKHTRVLDENAMRKVLKELKELCGFVPTERGQ